MLAAWDFIIRRRICPPRMRFWYCGRVESSVSIVLFFLLSGFFLAMLLGAVEHSKKLLAVAGGCLVAVACVVVFLTPVELPSWRPGSGYDSPSTTIGRQIDSAVGSTVTTEVPGAQ